MGGSYHPPQPAKETTLKQPILRETRSGSVSIRRRRIYMRAPSTLCRQTDISDIRCQFCQGPVVAEDLGTASSVAQGKD